MPGEWIPWDKTLTRKPEVAQIARATGLSVREVAATLMDFWSWVDDHSEDGVLCPLSVPDLSLVVSPLGGDTSETFWRAVVAVGWLVERAGSIEVPNFDTWISCSAKKRLKASRKKQRQRSKPNLGGTKSGHKGGHRGDTKGDTSGTGGGTTRQNKTSIEDTNVSSPEGRVRNQLWDAICTAFCLDPKTKNERSRVGKVVADLRTKGAAPEDIAVRLDRYRRAWPGTADTPEALLKHWDRFAKESEHGQSGRPVGPSSRVRDPNLDHDDFCTTLFCDPPDPPGAAPGPPAGG